MIYFTSDLHFGHSSVMGFHPCFRRFSSVDEMDKRLINIWNDRVSPADTVYNLGDISFHKDMEKNISIFKKLNGKHVLILGNHDLAIKAKQDELLSIKKLDGNALFEEICEYKDTVIEHAGHKHRLVMFHYPIVEWNSGHRSSIHLYGHLHANMAPIKGRAMNVGYDLHGKILDFNEIYEYIKVVEPFKHSEHRMFSEDDDIDTRSLSIMQMIEEINKA
ncbi:metallophosphoesterase [Campylobacter suis]|uniref:Calcineurin-like phosphoesterase domain-containing protein n=1 Tax=Campylobacter suis TaxID=2790657 RepID=A0ABM8Q7U3_9BACT|nr:metallophosphoesterase [Campylobacter suis]CAD7289039.1 hypothetical protein LMG8286_01624 [Campylobacter suis]